MLTYVFLLTPLILLLSVVYWSLRNGISPTPSSRRQIEAILQAIPPEITGCIYELGSGWGTLGVAVAKEFPECKIIGIENSHVPYWISRLLARICRLKNLTFRRANMLEVSLEDASLIVCYLYPGGMRRLQPALRDLKPGTLIISNTFSIVDWQPEKVVTSNDVYRSPIYVYKS